MQIGDGARQCASPAFGDERVSDEVGTIAFVTGGQLRLACA